MIFRIADSQLPWTTVESRARPVTVLHDAFSAALVQKLPRADPPTAGKPSLGGQRQLHSAVRVGGKLSNNTNINDVRKVDGEAPYCGRVNHAPPALACASSRTPRSSPALSSPCARTASAATITAAAEQPRIQSDPHEGTEHSPARALFPSSACSIVDTPNGTNTNARIRRVGARDVLIVTKRRMAASMSLTAHRGAALATCLRRATANQTRQPAHRTCSTAGGRYTVNQADDE